VDNKYLSLFNNCVFVNETRNSSLYDFKDGSVYKLDMLNSEVIMLTKKGYSVLEISKKIGMGLNYIMNILNNYVENELGFFSENKLFIEEYKIGNILLNKDISFNPVIYRCFIEISYACGLNCDFCDDEKINQCYLCHKQGEKKINTNGIKKFINFIVNTNCLSLVFHGGDPLLNPELLKEMIKFSRNKGFNGKIFVITNGKNIYKIYDYLEEYHVYYIIPYIDKNYMKSELLSVDEIIDLKNKYNDTIKITKLFTPDSFKLKEEKEIYFDYFSLKNPEIVYDLLKDNKGLGIPKVDANRFYHNKYRHPCLYGNLAIDLLGNIYPCPHMKNDNLGNIDENVIYDIFENKLVEYWNLSLSKLQNCSDCSLKYACTDCRAYEVNKHKEISKKIICPLK